MIPEVLTVAGDRRSDILTSSELMLASLATLGHPGPTELTKTIIKYNWRHYCCLRPLTGHVRSTDKFSLQKLELLP